MTRILVLGAGGMLGHKLCQRLPALGHEVVGALRGDPATLPAVFPECRLVGGVDVLAPGALEALFGNVRPAAVVNAVGIVKQLDAARNRPLSVEINAALPHRLARLCADRGARLIHVGTDCVFDGTRGKYRESDPSDARDLYGRSKYLGETDASEPSALTLRTSLIGPELRRPGHGLVEWFLSQKGKTVRGYARAVFSGLTTLEMARVVDLALRKGKDLGGTVHVASAPITKYDLLIMVRDAFGADIRIERDESVVVDRSLVMDRFPADTGYAAPAWEDMVREMAEDAQGR